MLLIADSAKERVNRNAVKEGVYMMMFAKGYIYNWLKRPFRVFQYRLISIWHLRTASLVRFIALSWKLAFCHTYTEPRWGSLQCVCITEHNVFVRRLLEKLVFFFKWKRNTEVAWKCSADPPQQLDFSVPKASQAECCLSCFPISCSSVTSGVEYKWFPLSVQCMPRGLQRP